MTAPDGRITTYAYDADNRLTGLVTKTSAGAVIRLGNGVVPLSRPDV